MSWSTQRTYAQATTESVERCRTAGIRFTLLTPPDVSREILVIAADVAAMRAFQHWIQDTQTLIEPDLLSEQLPAGAAVEIECAPSREQLLETKWIAEQIGVPVALYSAETFGGRCEFEFAWEFGPRERVFAFGAQSVEFEEQVAGWLGKTKTVLKNRWEGSIYEVSRESCTQHPWDVTVGGVLRYLLPSFGLESSTGFFRPHERGWRPR